MNQEGLALSQGAWPWGTLRAGAYRTILADPPWLFRNYSAAGEKKNPLQHYACMPLPEIQALPVHLLAAEDCVLVMWATAPMLPQAMATMAAWGFAYKGMGAWAKQSSTGQRWAFGPGYIYRAAMEPWLVGTRGQPKRISRSVRNLIVAPVREHSRKPDEMHQDLEKLFPGPRAELFSRQSRPGWDCWGLEAGKFDSADITGPATSR